MFVACWIRINLITLSRVGYTHSCLLLNCQLKGREAWSETNEGTNPLLFILKHQKLTIFNFFQLQIPVLLRLLVAFLNCIVFLMMLYSTFYKFLKLIKLKVPDTAFEVKRFCYWCHLISRTSWHSNSWFMRCCIISVSTGLSVLWTQWSCCALFCKRGWKTALWIQTVALEQTYLSIVTVC